MWKDYLQFDKRVYILAFAWLVTSAGFAMVIPYVSIYFFEELGISTTIVGLFFGITAVIRAVPQPFAGVLSDRIGRVALMGWSQLLRAITFLVVAYAMFRGAGFIALGSIICLNFFFGAFLHPTSMAYVADLVVKEQRIPSYSFLRIMANLGWAAGPAMGGFIAAKSYPALFVIAAVLTLISGLYMVIALKDVPRKRRADEPAFRLKDVTSLKGQGLLFQHCLITFVLLIAVAQLVAGMSLYSTSVVGISKTQLGFLFLINGAMVVLLQLPISWMLKRFRLTRQMASGALLYGIAYFMFGFAQGFGLLVVAIILISIAEMVVFPPSTTIVANLSPPDQYGRYMGVYSLFMTGGWSFGPTVIGVLLDLFRGQPIVLWSIVASNAMVAAVLYLWFERRLTPQVNSGLRDEEVTHAAA